MRKEKNGGMPEKNTGVPPFFNVEPIVKGLITRFLE
jgi:hypothetical protein